MPYIKMARRECLAQNEEVPHTPGELNYLLTRQIMRYLGVHSRSYTTFTDCLGALEGAKLEFYRRVITPYEEKKRVENGEVYPE